MDQMLLQAVILHLWQAVRLSIDTALSACVALHLDTPSSYAAAFFKLREANLLNEELATRLAHAWASAIGSSTPTKILICKRSIQ